MKGRWGSWLYVETVNLHFFHNSGKERYRYIYNFWKITIRPLKDFDIILMCFYMSNTLPYKNFLPILNYARKLINNLHYQNIWCYLLKPLKITGSSYYRNLSVGLVTSKNKNFNPEKINRIMALFKKSI